MREISQESLHNIRDIIPGENYANIKARLDQYLPANYSESFARINISSSFGMWLVDDKVKVAPYATASAEEKEEIAAQLEETKNAVVAQLRSSMPFIDKIFVIPSQEAIFWYRDDTGSIRVVLAQWGFRKRKENEDVDIIDMLISEPRVLTQVYVDLKFLYSDGKPACNVPFVLEIFNNCKDCLSDDEGNYNIGNLHLNKKFAVKNPKDGQRYEFTVVKDGKYEVMFDFMTDFKIRVKNNEGEIKPSFKICVNGDPVVTDNDGVYSSTSVKLTPDIKVEVALPDGSAARSYTLGRDPADNEFEYVVEEPEKEKKEPEKEVLPPPPPPVKNMTVELLDYDGTPLPGIPFELRSRAGEILQGVSDAEGRCSFPVSKFSDKGKYKITFKVTPEQRRQIDAGKNINNQNQKQ